MPCSPGGRFFKSVLTFTAPFLPGLSVTVPASLPSAVWMATTTGFTLAASAEIAAVAIKTARVIVRSSCISFLLHFQSIPPHVSLFLCVGSGRFHTSTRRRWLHRQQIVEAVEVIEQTAGCHQLHDFTLGEVSLQLHQLCFIDGPLIAGKALGQSQGRLLTWCEALAVFEMRQGRNLRVVVSQLLREERMRCQAVFAVIHL